VAPAIPNITSFDPSTGVVGDQITSASVLTLNGTAEVGSTVDIFDGPTQIGTTKTNGDGAWSFTTTELSNTVHNFTAKATNTTGKTSSASPPLNVKVDAATGTPTPSGENSMVKGALDGERNGFSRNDGYGKTVQTIAKQGYDLSVEAGSRPGSAGSTTTIEIAWSDPFVLFPFIFGAIINIRRRGSLNQFRKDSSSRPMTGTSGTDSQN
jgi:hypothetical protein